MKFNLILVFLFSLNLDYAICQNIISITQSIQISDSLSNESSINFIKIGGQVLGGAISGTIFSFPFYQLHPIFGGIGWLVGSSLGVYLIGNIGKQNSSYWGTLLGGAVGSTLFIVSFNKSIDGYGLYLGAILTSIPFEILSYYLFKSDSKNSLDLSCPRTNLINDYSITNKIITKPDISIQLINLNF